MSFLLNKDTNRLQIKGMHYNIKNKTSLLCGDISVFVSDSTVFNNDIFLNHFIDKMSRELNFKDTKIALTSTYYVNFIRGYVNASDVVIQSDLKVNNDTSITFMESEIFENATLYLNNTNGVIIGSEIHGVSSLCNLTLFVRHMLLDNGHISSLNYNKDRLSLVSTDRLSIKNGRGFKIDIKDSALKIERIGNVVDHIELDNNDYIRLNNANVLSKIDGRYIDNFTIDLRLTKSFANKLHTILEEKHNENHMSSVRITDNFKTKERFFYYHMGENNRALQIMLTGYVPYSDNGVGYSLVPVTILPDFSINKYKLRVSAFTIVPSYMSRTNKDELVFISDYSPETIKNIILPYIIKDYNMSRAIKSYIRNLKSTIETLRDNYNYIKHSSDIIKNSVDSYTDI